jgi:o-succinylbenzoate synthase
LGDLRITYHKRIFQFKKPSGTSRGILTEKKSWFLEISDINTPEKVGIGECSIIEGLSPDYQSDEQYERILDLVCENPSIDLTGYPSIKFGLETALLDLSNGGRRTYFPNEFTSGESSLPINGLVWMGEKEFMQAQIREKTKEGFQTIKMKIGAIDIESELEILTSLRNNHPNITIRVDANGAFNPEQAKKIMLRLAELNVHSIEQPIAPGQPAAMATLCATSAIPIALDEEMIGVNSTRDKIDLLDMIKPQFIILKPSLHGGISGTQEWIELAEERNIKWWITSALESNIGLDAICQFTANYQIDLPQGLGTGSLYVENIPSDLIVENGTIRRDL